MKSAVVRAFGQPLVLEDRPIPRPGPDEAIGEVLHGQAKAWIVLQP